MKVVKATSLLYQIQLPAWISPNYRSRILTSTSFYLLCLVLQLLFLFLTSCKNIENRENADP
ncbi:hypothetical protein DPMN_144820 [Dreissena polymorpha]|uniref:Uncharacterized protein n=1 Tax=Dreissena polymorpha TaxID=45954 RepID=A0A9D4F3X8_DREPO|nr:hypothetical protein DPMN_144820 [Dreissena polymorpha]